MIIETRCWLANNVQTLFHDRVLISSWRLTGISCRMRPEADIPQFHLARISVPVLDSVFFLVYYASTIRCDRARLANGPAVAANLRLGVTSAPTSTVVVVCSSRSRWTEGGENSNEKETKGWHASTDDADVDLDTRPFWNVVVIPGRIIWFGKCHQRAQAEDADDCNTRDGC